MERVNCLIIGSGPAGYTAGIYAARAGLQPVIYEGVQVGGQLMTTTEVDNFPGYPNGVESFQMMDDLRQQALRFGADIRSGVVTEVDFSQPVKHILVDNTTALEALSVIIATGASAKYLGLRSEKEFMGKGVSACAVCDGFFYRKKTVAVVGGGDTACEEASYLSSLCKKVYMIVRKPYLRATEAMQERVKSLENIEILFERETLRLVGDSKLSGADLIVRRGQTDEHEEHIDIDGFFLAIGHHPNTNVFRGKIELDDAGYILVNQHDWGDILIGSHPYETRTSARGVFAAGDVADPHYQQAITAAAAGAKAATDCKHYLDTL